MYIFHINFVFFFRYIHLFWMLIFYFFLLSIAHCFRLPLLSRRAMCDPGDGCFVFLWCFLPQNLRVFPQQLAESVAAGNTYFNIWMFPKIGGKPHPKMDGENNGKPY